ncbi:hypothetical protein [Kouleothrix sp.]|uniref:hypothetical protein n=1 Tax=Kouleothrix sp. TaxID=2779161 RepID=UPI00391CC4E9
MANFEDLLLAEFAEQHANMRQAETSMLQIVQFFLSIEGVALTGIFGLMALSNAIQQVLHLLFIIFWFLFVFGHFTFITTIYATINTLVIDFQNKLTRLYFSKLSPDNQKYIFFSVHTEDDGVVHVGDWEKMTDNRSATTRFVGNINSINLTAAIVFTAYSLFENIYPSVINIGIIQPYIVPGLVIVFMIYLLVNLLYQTVVYKRIMRKAEANNKKQRKDTIEQIKETLKTTETTRVVDQRPIVISGPRK